MNAPDRRVINHFNTYKNAGAGFKINTQGASPEVVSWLEAQAKKHGLTAIPAKEDPKTLFFR